MKPKSNIRRNHLARYYLNNTFKYIRFVTVLHWFRIEKRIKSCDSMYSILIQLLLKFASRALPIV